MADQKVRRRKGQLYRIEVTDEWVREWVLGYRQKAKGCHYSDEVALTHNDYVIYLSRFGKGFIKVLHPKGVLLVHSDWVTKEPESLNSDNSSRPE